MPLFWLYLAHWKVTIWRMLSVQQNHGKWCLHGSVWALIEVFVGACRMLRKFIIGWFMEILLSLFCLLSHSPFFFQATLLLFTSFFHNFHLKKDYVVDGSEISPATTVGMVLFTLSVPGLHPTNGSPWRFRRSDVFGTWDSTTSPRWKAKEAEIEGQHWVVAEWKSSNIGGFMF